MRGNQKTMPPHDEDADLERLCRNLRRHLPHAPARALTLLTTIPCAEQRRSLAALIASVWSRQDINTAWNAVSRSSLNATDKQVMYNELWG